MKRILYILALFACLLLSSCEKQTLSYREAFTPDQDYPKVKSPLCVGNFLNICEANGMNMRYTTEYDESESDLYSVDNLIFIAEKDLVIPTELLKERVRKKLKTVFIAENFKFDTGYEFPKPNNSGFDFAKFIEESKADKYEMAKVYDNYVPRNEYNVYSQFCKATVENVTTGMLRELSALLQSDVGMKNQEMYSHCINDKHLCRVLFAKNNAVIAFVSAPYIFTNACVVGDKRHNASLGYDILLTALREYNVSKIGKTRFVLEYTIRSGYFEASIDGSKSKGTPIVREQDAEINTDWWDRIKELWPLLLIFVPFLFRKHRAIKVIDLYRNRTLDYVKQVGRLYYKEQNWLLILRKRITYFAFDIQEKLSVDVFSNDSAVAQRGIETLARVIDMDEKKVRGTISKLSRIRKTEQDITEELFNEICSQMNEILKRLKKK